MKTAKVHVWVVVLICPECGEEIDNPDTGSMMWEITDTNLKRGSVITCCSCDIKSKVPARCPGEKL